MTQIISSRLQERVTSPHFFENSQDSHTFIQEQRAGHFDFLIEMKNITPVTFFGLIDKNQSPQKLLAIKYTCAAPEVHTALIDAYIDLITEKDEMKIDGISFREVDSFMRDKNDISALGDKNSIALAFFELTKKKINELFNDHKAPQISGQRISPTIRENYQPATPTLLSKYAGVSYMDLASPQKQDFIIQVMELHIAPQLAKDGGGASIVFADDGMVVIDYLGACTSCNFSLSSTLSFIQQVFRYETLNPNLLVMTDS